MDNDLIGQILVEQGVLTAPQVNQALLAQQDTETPLGRVVESLFRVERASVIDALAEQVATRAPDAQLAQEDFDPACRQTITAQEAWDHLLLPIRWDAGELLCATTIEALPGAIELLQAKLDCPYRFVIAEIRPIEAFIASLYEYEGVEVVE